MRVSVSRDLERWARRFDRIEGHLRVAVTPRWERAGEVLLDRATQAVHVDTGALRESGRLSVAADADGDVTAAVEFGPFDDPHGPYAAYEFRRGGSHDALARAFEATTQVFPQSLAQAWEDVWR